MFSRAEENLDKVVIPYYDPVQNRIRDFHPDFVFWMVEDDRYTILFVDPKGMSNINWTHKIQGYKDIFLDEKGEKKEFLFGGYKVRVALGMYTDDANLTPLEYRDFWYDGMRTLLGKSV
jgi:type III restriction enzyme